MKYLLSTIGYEELFGESGTPEHCIKYRSDYIFDTLLECLDFIKIHSEHSAQYMKYEIDYL